MNRATDWTRGWLLGADGLHRSDDGHTWRPAGGKGYPVTDLLRRREGLACATVYGLWAVRAERSQWVQMHDETLTEVLALAPAPGAAGVAAASPYGLAFGRRDAQGCLRWRSPSDGLSPNRRFANAVLARPDDPQRWLVGSEDGVLEYDAKGGCRPVGLQGRACRALLHAHGAFWAAADPGGVWRSTDGAGWKRAGGGLDDDSVFCLAAIGDGVLAGTLRGVCRGDGGAAWHRLGPALLVTALAAHPDADGPWLAGADPGGLWRSDDRGAGWSQTGAFATVRSILAPAAIRGATPR